MLEGDATEAVSPAACWTLRVLEKKDGEAWHVLSKKRAGVKSQHGIQAQARDRGVGKRWKTRVRAC